MREKNLKHMLEQIARNQLGVETLETRNSDSLDFHDVGVASLRDALMIAYLAGRAGVETAESRDTIGPLLDQIANGLHLKEDPFTNFANNLSAKIRRTR